MDAYNSAAASAGSGRGALVSKDGEYGYYQGGQWVSMGPMPAIGTPEWEQVVQQMSYEGDQEGSMMANQAGVAAPGASYSMPTPPGMYAPYVPSVTDTIGTGGYGQGPGPGYTPTTTDTIGTGGYGQPENPQQPPPVPGYGYTPGPPTSGRGRMMAPEYRPPVDQSNWGSAAPNVYNGVQQFAKSNPYAFQFAQGLNHPFAFAQAFNTSRGISPPYQDVPQNSFAPQSQQQGLLGAPTNKGNYWV